MSGNFHVVCNWDVLRLSTFTVYNTLLLKTIERDNKARDFLKAEMRFQRARDDMKTKQHAIEDAAKKTAEMQTRSD